MTPKSIEELICVVEFESLENQLAAEPDFPYIVFISNGIGDNVLVVGKRYTIMSDWVEVYGHNDEPLLAFPRTGTLWRIVNRKLARPSELRVKFHHPIHESDDHPPPGQYA